MTKHDLFNLYDPFDDVPPHAAAARLSLHTTTDDAGVRTLRHCGEIVGHYQRARQPNLWRGVTPAGAIVYGRTELSVRRELLERFA